MGVKGLWRLIESAGKPVSLESLNGKVLAVDVSIWLNKAAKGMRDKRGNAIYNAHLVLMFHRICKLLFYGIKPVFVFDGSVPELKKKTIKLRRERRAQADFHRKQTKDKMLENYLQTKALEAITGVKSSAKLNLHDKKEKEDIYELPQIPQRESSDSSSEEDGILNEDEWLRTLKESRIQLMLDKPGTIDTESENFNALPPEVKHELLTEIKDAQRRRYRRNNEQEVKLPEEADNFSEFQVANLMKRGKLTQQIDSLRKEMNCSMAAQFIEMFDVDKNKYMGKHIEGKRYISNEKQGYVLIKNVKSKGENVLFHTTLDDEYSQFKEQEQTGSNADLFQKLEREPAKFQVLVEKNASRKRLMSDSSDDGIGIKIPIGETVGKESVETAKDVVEFMSSSSCSEGSDGESSLQVPSEQQNKEKKNESGENKIKGIIDLSALTEKSVVLLERDKTANHDSQQSSSFQTENLLILSKNSSNFNKSDGLNETFKDLKQQTEEAIIVPGDAETLEPIKETASDRNLPVAENKELIDSNKFVSPTPSSSTPSNLLNLVDGSAKSMETFDKADASPSTCTPFDFLGHVDSEKSVNTFDDDDKVKASSSTTPSDLLSPVDSEKSTKSAENFDDKQANDEQQPGPSNAIPVEELISLQKDLEKEQHRLEDNTKRLRRQAATLSDETYQDVQKLLRLFGIPYLVSPAEAEAQCAQLDFNKSTDGSITDDSDVFLFGANCVYKNIFNQKKYAELYSMEDLFKKLYLTREKLIALAFMTGSDYTEGIRGIGAVTAMEVLHEFNKEKPKETLKFFKDWLKGRIREFTPGSNLKRKLKDTCVSQTFNSSLVWNAYLSPSVDTSDEQFEWGIPDIDAIKEYASEKLGWLYSKTDELLRPVLENIAQRKERQKTLLAYFQPRMKTQGDDKGGESGIQSKRLKKIVTKMSSGGIGSQQDKDQNKSPNSSKSTRACGSGSPTSSSSQIRASLLSKSQNETFQLFDNYEEDGNIDSAILNVPLEQFSSPSTTRTRNPSKSISLGGSGSPSSTLQASASLLNQVESAVSTLPYIDDTDVPLKRTSRYAKTSSQTSSSTVSQNEHVQAMKVANLLKAAEDSLKPSTPYIAMQNVNNLVWNRMRGKTKRIKQSQSSGGGAGKFSKRLKTTASLLEQVNLAAKSSVQSSESDSDN